jgi:hypothetical protein
VTPIAPGAYGPGPSTAAPPGGPGGTCSAGPAGSTGSFGGFFANLFGGGGCGGGNCGGGGGWFSGWFGGGQGNGGSCGGGLCGGGLCGGGLCGGGLFNGGLCHGGLCGGLDQPTPFAGAWSGGGGIYWMMPYFSSNPAYFAKAGTVTTQQNYDSHMSVAPTGFISYYFTPDWGVKFRWWQIDSNASANGTTGGAIITDPSGTGPGVATAKGATISANSNLYVSMYNLEIAHKWSFGCNNHSWVEVSGGVAYVHMSQSYGLNVADPAGAGSLTSIGSHDFNGWGPTIAFEGHYRLGDSDFGVYGSARGSLLFGSNAQNYFASSGAGMISGSSSGSSILPVGEVELGGEWSHCFCNRFRLYAQVGVVGQIWINGGDAAQGANINGTSVGSQISSPANFGFVGGVGRIGISF